MTNYTVIGHIAIDRVITATEERVQIGGPPTYATLAASLMGGEIEAITKVGSDIEEDHVSQLDEIGLDIRNFIVNGSTTTRFVLDYRAPERRLCVEGVGVDIHPSDVEEATEAVLLSPIVGEITLETTSCIDAEILALDPQGFVRAVQPDGTIIYREWYDEDLLQRTNVYKSSERELRLITHENDCIYGLKKLLRLGVELAIATKGQEGATLMTDGGAHEIPSVEGITVRDPTGAGDVFMSCLYQKYLEGEDPIWCACIGSALASAVVETVGPRNDLPLENLLERAENVYERVIRV
jgi:sugar/nucleoside kinase (ribokinase family)